jgi:hypothetical protein
VVEVARTAAATAAAAAAPATSAAVAAAPMAVAAAFVGWSIYHGKLLLLLFQLYCCSVGMLAFAAAAGYISYLLLLLQLLSHTCSCCCSCYLIPASAAAAVISYLFLLLQQGISHTYFCSCLTIPMLSSFVCA